MRSPFPAGGPRTVRWLNRALQRLHEALLELQRLPAAGRPHPAPAQIPVRAAPPPVTRLRHPHPWRE